MVPTGSRGSTESRCSSRRTDSTPPPTKPGALKADHSDDEAERHEQFITAWYGWKHADLEVRCYIEAGIPDTLRMQVLNSMSAKDPWDAILSEYQTRSEADQDEMLQRLHNERCSEVEDVRLHFTKMLRFREELAATGRTITEDHFASVLTNPLPTSIYGAVITAYTGLKMQGKNPTSHRLIEAVEEEYIQRQFANRGTPGSSTEYFTDHRQSTSNRNRKRKPNRCTNTKCKYRYTHELQDCRSEGGPQHESNVVRNGDGYIDNTFSTTMSFGITNTTMSKDPSERVEVYSSGATCHMSPYIDAFTEFEFIQPRLISTVDNRTFEAVGKGNLRIKIPNGDEFTSVTLRDVLYAPNVAFTLVSLSRADRAGYSTIIQDGELRLLNRKNGDRVIGRIPTRGGLWSVRSTKALENGIDLLPGNRTTIPRQVEVL